MPTPFPGMNPHLEREGVWDEFRTGFLFALQAQLTRQVRDRYTIRMVVRDVYGQGSDAIQPDAVIGPRPFNAPHMIQLHWDPPHLHRLWHLEVRSRGAARPVAVVEVRDPVNKGDGPDAAAFRHQRTARRRYGVSVVELDLCRGGPWEHAGHPPAD